ncbi:hypothetical protein FDI40_gp089 [Agrobacterium phage Atu_ph07]|uniref:Uncharacterized protein n=1 Tax=Agrobacterium phage Atu_ph07 TaxID=2024264 RepID=A0A2L0UZC0_9CAUD|nr:hypothetical protein FDI40_gp089 [Agrobacterium phage Atu_ph07]AUZ94895.1 hypothetical protein [Agrobacterium phage Atu_ph07]
MKSCIGCRFLFEKDDGYSNYTVTDTTVYCALRLNKKLPAEKAWDWNNSAKEDNWPKTNDTRCEEYRYHKRLVVLDVDGEDTISSQTDIITAVIIATFCEKEGLYFKL